MTPCISKTRNAASQDRLVLVLHYEESKEFTDDLRRHNAFVWKDYIHSKVISFSRMEGGNNVLHLPSLELACVYLSREDDETVTRM